MKNLVVTKLFFFAMLINEMVHSTNLKKPYLVASSLGPVNSTDIVIIQCPGCDTRFRVSDTTLKEYLNPNFHCSRCDLVFLFSESVNIEKPIENIPTLSVIPPEDRSYSPKVESLPLFPKNESSFTRNSEKNSILNFQIPKFNVDNLKITAPHENDPKIQEEDSQIQLQFPVKDQRSLLNKASVEKKKLTPKVTYSSSPVTEQYPLFNRSKREALSPKNFNLVLIAGLVFLVLNLLALLTYFVNSSTKLKETLAQYIMSTTLTVPEAAIQILTPVISEKILNNGEVVYIVKGSVINNSTDIINDVLLETQLYNKNSERIYQGFGYLGSIITKSNYENLDYKTIKELQSTKPILKDSQIFKNRLLPGKTADFFIAVSKEELESLGERNTLPNYFSVRIYSRNVLG